MSAEFMRNYANDIIALEKNTAFRDRGDFYSFVEFARESLEKAGKEDFSQISFYTENRWPFPGSIVYFLYPYRVIENTPSDTIIVYNSARVGLKDDILIVDGVSLGKGRVEIFRPNAFLFFLSK